MNEWLRDDSGASAVMVALMIVVLLGMVAIVIDGGMLYAEKRSMQNAADAGALAGVQELMPGSVGSAAGTADSYVNMNPAGADASEREYSVFGTYTSNDSLRVRLAAPSYALTLARLINVPSARVAAEAVAVLSSPRSFSAGIMPFGIMSRDTSGTTPFGYSFNESVTLRQATSGGEAGNFQLLDLPGTSDLKKVVSAGGTSAYIGEDIQSHPGLDAAIGPTLDKYVADPHTFDQIVTLGADGIARISDYSCPHLIVCPIVYSPPSSYSWAELNGKSDLQILAFAFFWVDGVSKGAGGHIVITGRFVRPLTPEEVSGWGAYDPYGAIAFRLTD